MNYLITGAKGFIGGFLCRKICKNLRPYEDTVFTFDEENFQKHWISDLDFYVFKADVIFHIGAVSSTDAQDVNKTMFLNYEFSKKLFDLAHKYNKKVIFSSSAAVYGNDGQTPQNLYAWTKKAAEDYGLAKVKNFISLRYFNVYGEINPNKGKMSSIARQVYDLSRKWRYNNPFYLFGGKPTRDFVYIEDIISANLYAADPKNNVPTGIYDVGTGKTNTFEKVLDLMNYKYAYREMKEVPSWYQFKTQANKDKFLPGWKPEFNLENGMKHYVERLQTIETKT